MALTKIRAEQISDIDFKQAVRVVATTNVTLTNGAVDTIDGVSLAVSDRVLVTAQATASQNGLYRVSVLGTGADGTWVRSSDGDATGDMSAGMLVTVTEGTVYADTQWQLTTNNPIVLGTTSLVFAQSSPADSYTAGTGLTLTVLTFSVNAAQTQITSVGTLTALSVSGTVTGGNVATAGAITGASSSVSGTVTGASVVGGVITGSSVSVIGNITTTANVTGGYILGNGSQLTGVISSYGNSNVAAYLPTYTGNLVALTGNIITTANVTSGNLLTGGLISAIGTVTGGNVSTAGAITGASSSVTGIVTGASVVGGVITGSSSSVTGIVTGASVVGGVITGTSVSVSGNITGGNVIGGANVNATTHTGTTVSVTGNVTSGNIITGGIVSATGNVTSGASLNTINLSLSGNVLGNLLPSANITYNLGSTTQRWNTLFLAGNTIDLGSQTISSSESGVSMGTGNLTGGNILTSGLISAAGNIYADDIYANSYTVGTSYNISAYSATTASSASDQEIYSIAPGQISSIDFKIIAYCNTGETHTKTTTFITTTILSSTLVWAEYGRLNINSGVGTLSMAYISGGGVSPMIKLLATPSSSNLTYYNLIISIYN